MSSEEAASRADPPEPSVVTAVVERRALQEKITTRGDVAVAGTRPLRSWGVPEVENPVVTKVHIVAGGTLSEGDVAIEVSGRPVFVLRGSFPIYRDLTQGDRGEDVVQLESSLVRLGYMSAADDTFTDVTTSAVRRFYLDRGFGPVEAELGADQDESSADTPPPVQQPPPRLVVRVPRGEIVTFDELPGTVSKVEATVGNSPGDTPAQMVQGGIVINATVTSSQAKLVEKGTVAIVDDPGTDLSFSTKVTDLTVANDEDQPPSDEEPTSPGGDWNVLLAPDVPVDPALVGRNLRVTITSGKLSAEELVVPVTAVSERADGVATVAVRNGEKIVEVKVLGSAGGFVAVKGDLEEGDKVVVER